MKRVFPLLFLSLIIRLSFGQIFQIGDTSDLYNNKHPGQGIIESKKFGSINYARLTGSVDVGIFLQKIIDKESGHILKAISFEGYLTSGLSNSDFYQGEVYEKELDKFIKGLIYINDSLLPSKPTDRIFYFVNLESSNIEIEADFNPYSNSAWSDKNTWSLYLNFNRYRLGGLVTMKNKDCKVLIDALKKAKEQLQDF